ncbi:hypothetical protein L2E82_15040 [Cichorium intybus]|uniref:Uncharacterized protein n=1 Tax=Cichorium intybus TaxID=13427 RepID=A0ACB9F1Q2_CICIN|nr:hypothetical protein L2E82_15040 [Cichorium intybus]
MDGRILKTGQTMKKRSSSKKNYDVLNTFFGDKSISVKEDDETEDEYSKTEQESCSYGYDYNYNYNYDGGDENNDY